MIAAILITALVLAVAAVWILVLVLETMSDIRKACRAYVARGENSRGFSKPPMAPSGPTTSPQEWGTRRNRP